MSDALIRRICLVTADFEIYLKLSDSWEHDPNHIAAITRLGKLGGPARVATVASDTAYLTHLAATLKGWHAFGRPRGFKHPTPEVLGSAVSQVAPALSALASSSLDDPNLKLSRVSPALWSLISQLTDLLNPGAPPWVGASKVLHHLLPDLMPPIDRVGTGWFFGWSDRDWTAAAAFKTFEEAFPVFHDVPVVANVRQYVSGTGWRTSVGKVVDDAILAMR
ncbi:MAG: hypothetical protein ABR925_06055 [Acidimicrobiales bacterium]